MRNPWGHVLLASFLIITVLTSIFVLLANVCFFGPDVMHSEFARWGFTVVLAGVVGSIFTAFRLIVTSAPMILLVFDLKSTNVSKLNLAECLYETRDSEGQSVHKGSAKLVWDNTSSCWKCFVPLSPDMQFQHTTTVKLKDNKGREVLTASDFILQHTISQSISEA